MARSTSGLYLASLTGVNRQLTSFFVMSKKPKTDEEGFELVLTKLSRAEIARGLGIKKQNLTRWKRVPPHHVTKLAQLTGLAREDILPSMYA